MDRTLALIARTLRPPRGRAWHGGPTPVDALLGLTAREAHRRPAPGRHSIWELVLHIAYWDYAVRRRILGTELPRFPRSPANWPAVPARPEAKAWAADRALLAQEHRLLHRAVERFPAAWLGRKVSAGERWTYGDTILGIAVHDAYHAGQVQILKRLVRKRG